MIDRALAAETRAIYERHAEAHDQQRELAAGGAILDVGCSVGEPIANPTCRAHTVCLAKRA